MGFGLVDELDERAYTKWVLTKTLWPKYCAISGKRIPMYSNAYCKTDGAIETWALADEFIIARLKGEV